MSTASPALPGKPSFGGLLARIIFIVLLWAALVTGTLHYVGYAWPKAYQISLAEKAQAEEKAMTALNPAPTATAATAAPAGSTAAATTTATAAAPAPTMTPAATTTAPLAAPPAGSAAPTPATSSTTVASTPAATAAPAPAAGSTVATTTSAAAPAGSAPASTAAPAPAATSAPKAATGEQKLPFDLRLAGYNRTALENVSIFFSIVISVFCVGGIILQIFKYKQIES